MFIGKAVQTSALAVFILLFCLNVKLIFAQNSFEGIIESDIISEGEKINLNWHIKGSSLRLEYITFAEGKKNGFIVLRSNDKLYLLSLPDNPQLEAINLEYKDEALETKLNAVLTGDKSTILGKECYKVEIKGEKTTTELWNTTDFSVNLHNIPSEVLPIPELKALFSQLTSGFPLKAVTKDNLTGKILTDVNTTKLNEKKLDDKFFTIPSNYKVSHLSDK